jgi:nucleotide-binding universal stress UspA family protein
MQPAFHGRRRQLYREFDRLLRQPMEEYLADVARRIARASPAFVTPMVVDGRQVYRTLPDIVESGSGLVVMATRGRSAIGRMLVGRVSDAVIQRTSAPVLHVRGYNGRVDLTARPPLRHALVALDGSPQSACVLPPVAALGKLTGGPQTLLRVVPPEGALLGGNRSWSTFHGPGEQNDRPVVQLTRLAESWRTRLPQARTSVVWSETTPSREILAQAHEVEADFIAVATRSRARLTRLLRPGVLDHLIRRAEIPVLVVKQARHAAVVMQRPPLEHVDDIRQHAITVN